MQHQSRQRGDDDFDTVGADDQILLESHCRDVLKKLSGILAADGLYTPIMLLEMLVAGMFVVEEAYAAANRDRRSAQFVLDGFRAELITFAAYEYYLTQRTRTDLEDLFDFSDQFHTLRHVRYAQYSALCGTRGQSVCLTHTVRALLAHLRSRGLPKHVTDHMFAPVRDQLATTYAAFTRSLLS